MDGGKFLEASHPPETEHRVFSSPERPVGILRTIIQPAASLMQTGSAQFTQCRAVRPQPIRADLGGKDRAKTVPPEPDRLVAHLDPALVEKVLNIA